jgi:hypothetical protein
MLSDVIGPCSEIVIGNLPWKNHYISHLVGICRI